jgi:hypothetical protein
MRTTAVLALALALSACKIYGGLTDDDITAVKAEIADEAKVKGLTLIEIKFEREIDDTRASGYIVTGRGVARSTSDCEIIMMPNGQRDWSCLSRRP